MNEAELIVQNAPYPIPVGRRIVEIMREKGDAFSIRAFAKRMNMNRETLRTILSGERPASPSELEQIAVGLGVSLECIRQVDTYSAQIELESLLQSKRDFKKALDLAQWLVKVAKGLTEKCNSLNNLGRVLYLLPNYKEAHHVWSEAYEYAKSIHREYGETALLYKLMCNLMLTHNVLNDFSAFSSLLVEVEKVFDGDQVVKAIILDARARVAERQGDLESAKKNAYEALQIYYDLGDRFKIGRAESVVAHYQFLDKNYFLASEMLEKSIKNLEGYESIRMIVVKDYIKTLLKLKKRTQATHLIDKYLEIAARENSEVEAKLRIIQSYTTGETSNAENVARNVNYPSTVRQLACNFLVDHYNNIGDSQSLMKYYNIAVSLSASPKDFLEEEDL